MKLLSYLKKIILPAISVSIIALTTSCNKNDFPKFDNYYRYLTDYGKYTLGLDISLIECDFSKFVSDSGEGLQLKNKLERVENGSSIAPSGQENLYYIGDRTFSLAGATSLKGNQVSLSIGTAWILAKDSTAPYKYWMMTNWHVTVNWMYSDDKFGYVWWGTNYGNYQTTPYVILDNNNRDYHQFENPVVKLPEGFNKLAPNNSSILLTPFYRGIANIQTNVLSAGYPFDNNSRCAYFKHSNATSQVVGVENLGSPHNTNNWVKFEGTHIGSTGNWYELTPYTFNDMEGGSSGSMIIETTTREVIGLYWGGYSDNDQDIVTQPRGVILNTNNHSGLEWNYEYNKLDVISKMIGCSSMY